MVRRQTYHEGPPTPDEFAIFDFDPTDQEPYYYNRRYESHLYQTEQEKSREIFRLLRSLSERLDAQDSRRTHYLWPRNTGEETAKHQNMSTSPTSPIEKGRSEYVHTTVEEISSPEWRLTVAEKGQSDETNPPIPDTTTSEDPCKPDNQVKEIKTNQATDPSYTSSTADHRTRTPKNTAQADDIDQENTTFSPRAVTCYTKSAQPLLTSRLLNFFRLL